MNETKFSLSDNCNRIESLLEKRIQSLGILRDGNINKLLNVVIEVICHHIFHSGKILIAGNGGSASQSQHLCSELMGRFNKKRSPVEAISLSSDISLITCIANDFGYERIFSRQIEGLGHANDVFIAFTTSGKSRNIIEALNECKSCGICSIVFTGKETEAIKRLADYIVAVPIEDTAIVQEIHMQFIHIICEILEDLLPDDDSVWDEVLELGRQGNKYLILDRDGVINHIKANGYIKSPSDFSFREDFLTHIKQLSDIYERIFMVSNQKGVGKGLVSMEELRTVHAKMVDVITRQGGRIDNIYVGTNSSNDAYENKPNTGMADLIKEDYPDVDFSKTVVVGDSASDYLFADNIMSKFVYARTR